MSMWRNGALGGTRRNSRPPAPGTPTKKQKQKPSRRKGAATSRPESSGIGNEGRLENTAGHPPVRVHQPLFGCVLCSAAIILALAADASKCFAGYCTVEDKAMASALLLMISSIAWSMGRGDTVHNVMSKLITSMEFAVTLASAVPSETFGDLVAEASHKAPVQKREQENDGCVAGDQGVGRDHGLSRSTRRV